MDTFAERLKHARDQKGISQEALAAACGWKTRTRITNYEKDQEPENLDAIERLAAALDVSPAWLAFGESPGERLSAEEKNLLKLFRKTDDARRGAVRVLLDPHHGVTAPDESGEPITEDMFGSATDSHQNHMKRLEKAQAQRMPLPPTKRILTKP